jgi:Ca2+-binding EF-hand superfamily protein
MKKKRLNIEQIDKFKQAFNLLDTNQSGKITSVVVIKPQRNLKS